MMGNLLNFTPYMTNAIQIHHGVYSKMPLMIVVIRALFGKLLPSMLKDKWPGAYRAVEAFTSDDNEMGNLVNDNVSLGGNTVEAVVAEWMANKMDGASG